MLESLNLDDVFCLQGIRTINNGYIIKWANRKFVLSRPSLTLRRQKVVVREWFEGRLSIRFKGEDLEYKEVDMARPKPAVRVFAIKRRRKPPKYIPFLGASPHCPGPEVKTGQIHVAKNRTFLCCADQSHKDIEFFLELR